MDQEDRNFSSTHLSALASIRDSTMIDLLKEEGYSIIRPVIEKPSVSTSDWKDFWIKVLPYLTQNIKMWNCDALSAQNLNALVKLQKKSPYSDSQFTGDSSNLKTSVIKPNRESNEPNCPVSRLDCLAIVLNTADTVIAEDILRIMSKFPMTLPLIIPDIDKTGQYIVTIPYIQNIVIKWESNPGEIVENRLFTDLYSMVVALRLGINEAGKSTVLNQLLKKQFIFSSSGEPGANFGQPLTLDGSVEMLWLTQETCSDVTWKTTMSKFYEDNADRPRVALLANLHGDALQHTEIIKFIAKYARSFIVFVMPDASEKQILELQVHIPGKNVLSVLVDPEKNEKKSDAIFIKKLSRDDTLQTVRELLREGFSSSAHNFKHSVHTASTPIDDRLRFAKSFHCANSDKIIELVIENSCSDVKRLLSGINIKMIIKLIKLLKELFDLVSSMFSQPSACINSRDQQKLRNAEKDLQGALDKSLSAHNFRYSGDTTLTAIDDTLRAATSFHCETCDNVIEIVIKNRGCHMKRLLSDWPIGIRKIFKLIKLLKELFNLLSSMSSQPSTKSDTRNLRKLQNAEKELQEDLKQIEDLQKQISGKNVLSVLMDSTENGSESDAVHTKGLTCDETLQIVRELLHEGFDHSARSFRYSVDTAMTMIDANSFHCAKCDKVIETFKENSCRSIDIEKIIKLIELLKKLYNLISSIMSQPPKEAKQSLVYLETHLSQISTCESLKLREEACEASEKIQEIKKYSKNSTQSNSPEQQTLQNAEKDLREALDKLDSINLGQEHLCRMLGHIYEESITIGDFRDFQRNKHLSSHFANLLISGHAIEILNGDTGEVQSTWIKAIYDNVSKQLGKLRVFVISIIGVQSSGKSTLLNALFSCKFAVSVGRCTRGLFMRMVFLDEELRKSLAFDCIIIIDTEGLCSTEKMNDPKAKPKDRLMATFAMGISNLTLVNIMGEGMTEMTEILQIAIVAMARLRSGDIKPDILIVQHLQERNLKRVDKAKKLFCDALNNAFVLIDKNDVEIGSTYEECLTDLITHIQSGGIFKHFGAFKDGSSVNSPPSKAYHDDVVDLYKMILERAKNCNTKCSFRRWSELFQSFWQCVQEETFALSFINVKQITDHLYFIKMIDKVKELNGRAIRRHRDIFSEHINATIASKMKETDDRKFHPDDIRDEVLESVSQKMEFIPHRCVGNETKKNGQDIKEECDACSEFQTKSIDLLNEIEGTEWKEKTIGSLKEYNKDLHEMAKKMLKQSFDAYVVKQGCFSKFADLIEKELNKALDQKPSGKFTEQEQQNIARDIWQLLQYIAGDKETDVDLHKRIENALLREYVQSGIIPNILSNFKNKPIKFFRSLLRKAGVTGDIDKLQIEILKQKLDWIVEEVLRSRGDEYERTGLDFDDGMVAEIKERFPVAVKLFEKTHDVLLQDSFKTEMQMYTLQHLDTEMVNLQKIWDSQNKPSAILEGKKEEYMKIIMITLKTEFSFAGDAEIVAGQLSQAIKKNAAESALRVKIQAVKNESWTANSEKVRLRYFAKLAEEVAEGEKDRALEHFDDPKTSLVSWFKNEVETLIPKTELMERYRSALTDDFVQIMQRISKSSEMANINDIIEQYDIKLKLKVKDGDFQSFRSRIVRNLEKFRNSAMTEDVTFTPAYEDSEVKRILGCTERCPWCGAICWGSVNHRSDVSDTFSVHYSCHQPRGLSSKTYLWTGKLHSRSCYHRDVIDKIILFFQRYNVRSWKVDPHCVKEFDQLMCWFFKELHEDIAHKNDLLPADNEILKSSGFFNLNLKEILKVVKSQM